MRQSEKKIFAVVALVFAAFIGFTVYLETRVKDKLQTAAANIQKDLDIPAGPQVWVIPKGMTAAGLPQSESRGASVLLIYCAQCHDLPTPSMHSAQEWHEVLKRMEKHIQSRRGGMLARVLMPPEKDWKVLDEYLSRFSQKPLSPEKLALLQQQADWDSKESRSFQATCGQCHAIPDPAQHSAREWPRVVLRMKNNIRSAKIAVPDNETTEQIITYLQRHSKS